MNPTINLSNTLTIIGAIITFGMALLQMYITFRLLKYKDVVKKEILDEVQRREIEVYKDINNLEKNIMNRELIIEKFKNLEEKISKRTR